VAPLTLPVFMMQVIKLNGALQFRFVSYLARLRMMPLLTMCSDKFKHFSKLPLSLFPSLSLSLAMSLFYAAITPSAGVA